MAVSMSRFLFFNPFLILARADLGLTSTVSIFGNPLDPSHYHERPKVSSRRKAGCMLHILMGLRYFT